ncbi:MAG: hypothetical protein NTY48_01885 [Candidatus Diapherotrites archaeon]|nr:hypothetical protein [Candidatus Diapherotrites archaeon]
MTEVSEKNVEDEVGLDKPVSKSEEKKSEEKKSEEKKSDSKKESKEGKAKKVRK